MQTESITEPKDSIQALERKYRRLTLVSFFVFVLAAVSFLWQLPFMANDSRSPEPENILRVRGIAVVDENGTERIWIGAPVPEPLILGKRFPRGGKMSGIILFDEEGNERSGYCTSDGYPNVLFTLDSIGQQHALFMAEPQGDTAFWIWNGGNSFKLSIGEGNSKLALSKGGKVLFEEGETP